MIINFIVANYYPHIGGVEKHVREVSRQLVTEGHKVRIFVPKFEPEYPGREWDGEIEVIRLTRLRVKVFSELYLRWQMLTKLPKLLNADLVHYHDFGTFWDFGLWLYPLLKLFRKKIYLTFHGYEGDVPPKRRAVRKRRISARLVDRNLCVGHFIEKWYGTKADMVIYGGTHPCQEEIRRGDYALFVGRLAEDTGVRAYLEAWRLIAARHPGMRFIICGGGPLADELIQQVEVEQIPRVVFQGFVEKPELFLRGAALVFTSGYLAILEAFSCKKPVVSYYDNPLKKDYLEMMPESQGMLWLGSNVRELADLFEQALVDEGKVQMAYQFSLENSWQKVARDYTRLWGFCDSDL